MGSSPEEHPPQIPFGVVSTRVARPDPTSWRTLDIPHLLEMAQKEAEGVEGGHGKTPWRDALINASYERMVALVGGIMSGRTEQQRRSDRCREVVHHVFCFDLPGWLLSKAIDDPSRGGFCGWFRKRAIGRLNELAGAAGRRRSPESDVHVTDPPAASDESSAVEEADLWTALLERIDLLPDADQDILNLRFLGYSLAQIARMRSESPDAVYRRVIKIEAGLRRTMETRP